MPRNQNPMPTVDPPSSGGSALSPIGVPSEVLLGIDESGSPVTQPYLTNYQDTAVYSGGRGATVPGSGGRGLPTFYEGDEVAYVYGMNSRSLALFQQQLTQAGLLDPASYSPGFVGGGNDPTLAAVQLIMGFANRAGYRTVSDAVRAYINGGFGAVGSQDYEAARKAASRPMPAPVSNADDLKRVFRAAVIDTLGTGWSEGDINAMVANYQAQERAFNSRAAAGEAIDEQLAAPETFAIQQATAKDPTSAQGQEFLAAANDLQSMLGRWSGS